MGTLRFGRMILLSTFRAISYHTAPKKLYRYFKLADPGIALPWVVNKPGLAVLLVI